MPTPSQVDTLVSDDSPAFSPTICITEFLLGISEIRARSVPLKTYAAISYAHLPASGNGKSCLGPVFRPLTDSDQNSFPIFLCHIVVPHFLDKIK